MNIEQILETNLKLTLSMEWYGIRAEETKEIGYATYHYVSVPESSTIEIEDQELNVKIKTADGLKKIARDMLVKQLLDYCKAEFDDEEFIQEIKDDISEYIKVFARVRKGEVWTQEMGEARLEELTKELKQATEYKEV